MFLRLILLFLVLDVSIIALNGQMIALQEVQESTFLQEEKANIENTSEKPSIQRLSIKKEGIMVNGEMKQGKQYLDLGDSFTLDDLKAGLKSIKETTGKQKNKNSSRKDYRDIKVVLEELGQYGFSGNTHQSLIKDFLVNYTQSDIANKIFLLTEIEFLVHQYSVAQDFVGMGGVEILLHDIATFNNETLQALIAMTLGSAMQGNSPVKQAVLQSDAIPLFLTLLESSDSVLVSRVLFAISALIRQHPAAQKAFVMEDGFKTLARLFAMTQLAKLIKKIMTLIYDLLSENKIDEDAAKEAQNLDAIKESHFRKMELEILLKQNNFCNNFVLLTATVYDEAVESLILALPYLKYGCKNEFIDSIYSFKNLAAKYKQQSDREIEQKKENTLITEPSDDLHFLSLYNCLLNFVSELELFPRDEL